MGAHGGRGKGIAIGRGAGREGCRGPAAARACAPAPHTRIALHATHRNVDLGAAAASAAWRGASGIALCPARAQQRATRHPTPQVTRARTHAVRTTPRRVAAARSQAAASSDGAVASPAQLTRSCGPGPSSHAKACGVRTVSVMPATNLAVASGTRRRLPRCQPSYSNSSPLNRAARPRRRLRGPMSQRETGGEPTRDGPSTKRETKYGEWRACSHTQAFVCVLECACRRRPRDALVCPQTTRCADAEGNFDEYKNAVQKSMERPYPDNGGFYGLGSLREMGLRKSRHSGDWRTKSQFQNKEEEFTQPLRGYDTVLEKGITIRGAGGQRLPAAKTGDGVSGAFQEPSGGQASTAQNVAIIRSLGKSLALPQSVAERRTFEEVSSLVPGHHFSPARPRLPDCRPYV